MDNDKKILLGLKVLNDLKVFKGPKVFNGLRVFIGVKVLRAKAQLKVDKGLLALYFKSCLEGSKPYPLKPNFRALSPFIKKINFGL